MTKSVPLESRVPSPLCLQYFSVYFCVSLDMKAVVCWSWLVPACKSWLLNFLAFCKPVESRTELQCPVRWSAVWRLAAQHSGGNGASRAGCHIFMSLSLHEGYRKVQKLLPVNADPSQQPPCLLDDTEWMNEWVCVCVCTPNVMYIYNYNLSLLCGCLQMSLIAKSISKKDSKMWTAVT